MDYQITKTNRVYFIDDRGVSVDGYRVYFKMANGQVDYVEIEKSLYNKENVSQAIESTIEQHLEVLS